ncbi:MAG: hypothetical protein WCX73_05555 [Candidatus Pacearchaeota archaeon]|jgi:hypothetical protein
MIENKVKAYFKVKTLKNPELSSIKTLVLKNPRLFDYVSEQEITNGLGYLPVRKAMHETKSNTWIGLKTHLQHMQVMTNFRKTHYESLLMKEFGSAFLSTEKMYNDFNNLVKDSLVEIKHSVDMIHKKMEIQPTPTNNSKKNEEPLYKRVLHKIGF